MPAGIEQLGIDRAVLHHQRHPGPGLQAELAAQRAPQPRYPRLHLRPRGDDRGAARQRRIVGPGARIARQVVRQVHR